MDLFYIVLDPNTITTNLPDPESFIPITGDNKINDYYEAKYPNIFIEWTWQENFIFIEPTIKVSETCLTLSIRPLKAPPSWFLYVKSVVKLLNFLAS